MKMKTANLMRRICRECLEPPPEMTVSQWAERYRVLDSSSAYPGRWSNDVTPYLRDIMDEFNNPHTREIIFCKPTQVGGTEVVLNILGYAAGQDQAPTMAVIPTDELAKTFVEARFQPMVDKSPDLRKKYLPRKSRRLQKRFVGMTLYLTGSNSPSKLASKAIKNLLMDETDKWPSASKKEANPVDLARERTKTFTYTKKIYDNCTPTLRSGHIWQAKEKADVERHYFVPCPHCDEYIELIFDQIKWPKGEGGDDEGQEGQAEKGPKAPSMTDSERAEQALYFCQECGAAIGNMHKPAMLRKGEWREVRRKIGAKQIPRSVAFWINTLYSPFVTWEHIAQEFLDSQGDLEKLQNFRNSWLAEPWEDLDTHTDVDMVLARQTDVPVMVVPEWAELLTAGIDVQKNSVYWAIRAWGPYITSQNIAHGQALSLEDAALRINITFRREDGREMLVALCGVDSGDQTDMVYEFCSMNADWTIPVKGASLQYGSFRISKIDKEGSRANGRPLLLVNGDAYKDMIATRMRRDNGPNTGSWMVHAGCDHEYAEQVTAEHKINVTKAGKRIQVWAPKTSHADNHYLDCEVYAACAADLRGVRDMHLMLEQGEYTVSPDAGESNQQQEGWLPNVTNWLEPRK